MGKTNFVVKRKYTYQNSQRFFFKMFNSCTRQTKIITAIVIGVTVLCIIGEFIYLIFSPCRTATDKYEEEMSALCSDFKWLLPLIIFLPALIGFIILGIRIYLDRRELEKHQEEANALNSRTIVKP